ncbi:uncharacterized protein F5147DRAFT_811524 [Suillus discolor]|uniref:Uncharacterized protein n=1 Tax=Suillus discolor TaxID=1912936 RepID=A0A9P7JZ09_9AGAM|nr:uncharacterized protein F5147DRAFT_811524 [Suillus discolor]KAG2117186.1 hypothetical protein F5147DRAFT_811524 [Suillus discolor]
MLPVTVEESKAQRLQRQQARFRDRGGAFVPSEKNVLKDILLARTVSGESPSKVATKSPYRHRSRSTSPSKAKRNKTASKARGSPINDKVSRSKANTEAPAGLVSRNAAAGPSTESGGKISKVKTRKKAGPTTRKVKDKVKATDGQLLFHSVQIISHTTCQATMSQKQKQPKSNLHPTAEDGRRKPNLKLMIMAHIYADPESSNHKMRMSKEKPPGIPKVKTKTEAPRSDDEGTLVEAPRPKTHSKRKPVIVTIEPDDEDAPVPDNKPAAAEPWAVPKSAHKRPSAKDAPLNRAQAKQRTGIRKEHLDEAEPTYASRVPKSSTRTEVDEESPNLVKTKIYGSLTVDIPMKRSTTNPKRSAPDDDVSGDVKQPLKKPKVSKSQSTKSLLLSNSVAVSKPDPEDTAVKKPHSVMKQDTKKKKAHPQESDDEDHMPKKPVSKKARFEEPKPGVHISSEKHKENALPLRKPRSGKPNSKSKSRGPPKDVLDRIKASATLHRIDDSEPDPLDCLS